MRASPSTAGKNRRPADVWHSLAQTRTERVSGWTISEPERQALDAEPTVYGTGSVVDGPVTAGAGGAAVGAVVTLHTETIRARYRERH